MADAQDPLEPATPHSDSAASVTALLQQWGQGSDTAEHQVFDLVYRELHRLAKVAMRRERADHTLQTTALVNEAYVRLVQASLPWENRRHFYAVAARSMRRILVDHARHRVRQKRGGNAERISLDEVAVVGHEVNADVVALDEALDRLAVFDSRKAQVVELFYFGGLSYEDIAQVVDISAATVHRDLRMAKAWLYQQLR